MKTKQFPSPMAHLPFPAIATSKVSATALFNLFVVILGQKRRIASHLNDYLSTNQ